MFTITQCQANRGRRRQSQSTATSAYSATLTTPGARRGSSLKPSPAAPRQPMRSARSSGQRPNRQLVATRRHGTATINSIRRLPLTLTGSPRFMKYAAATSGHQFPLVRFPASRATLEFTTKFIVIRLVALARLPRLPPSAKFKASLAGESPGNGGASLVVRFMIERQLLDTSTRGSVAPRRTSNCRFTGDYIHSSLLRRGATEPPTPSTRLNPSAPLR